MKQARSMTARSHRQWLKSNEQRDDADSHSKPAQPVPWTNQTINELSMEYAYETTAPERNGRLSAYGSMIERYTKAMKVKRVKHPQLYQASIEAHQAQSHRHDLQISEDDIHESPDIEQSVDITSIKPSSVVAIEHVHVPTPTAESHTISTPRPQTTESVPRPDPTRHTMSSQQRISQPFKPSPSPVTKSPHKLRRTTASTHSHHHDGSSTIANVASHLDSMLNPNNPVDDTSADSVEAHRILLAMEDRVQLAYAISPATYATIHSITPHLEYDHPERNLRDKHRPQSIYSQNLTPDELRAQHDRNQQDRLSKLESMSSLLQQSRDSFTHTASTVIANQKKLIRKNKHRQISKSHSHNSTNTSSQISLSSDPDYSSDEEPSTVSLYSDPSLIAEIIKQPSATLFSAQLQRTLERRKKSVVADTIRGTQKPQRVPDQVKVAKPVPLPDQVKVVKSVPVTRPEPTKSKPTSTRAANDALSSSSTSSSIKLLTAITDNYLSKPAISSQPSSSYDSSSLFGTGVQMPIQSSRQHNDPYTFHRPYQPSHMEESKESVIEPAVTYSQTELHDRLGQIEARLQTRWAQERAVKAKPRVRFSEDFDYFLRAL